MPLLSGGSVQEEGNNNKPEREQEQVHQQLRKGKYVSPVWKPNEMLWLARAWKEQYHGGSGGGGGDSSSSRAEQTELGMGRGKTRADKDREVAEFLKRHGVNRDAKTAGTKWDNMLGEFRKVYEWERGGEREQIGKSYFRLSPYERKLHRLPASFDEEVFDELSLFMGSRMRSSHGRAGSSFVSGDIHEGNRTTRSLPPPRPFKEDEHLPLSGLHYNSMKMGKHMILITFQKHPTISSSPNLQCTSLTVSEVSVFIFFLLNFFLRIYRMHSSF